MCITKMVLVRHGESKWNQMNRFTGWTDIDLSEKGIIDIQKTGMLLKEAGFIFDFAYTSLLKRAIHSIWNILDQLDQVWVPLEKSWRLNERHYGALQGMNKDEIAKKYGMEQVHRWRRSFYAVPPKLDINDKRAPRFDLRYAKLDVNQLPLAESLEMTIHRVLPYWKEVIFPHIRRKENVIISAHGNSIRAIVQIIEELNEEEISELNIPNSIPLVYDFKYDPNTNTTLPIRKYYLKK
ncbi:2,3-diphosphoglycerate-dependent phosphoglycerate mutase [Candidatus Schneideria nysicola]|uniref:2,3-diphosphoglycerate-dependent phosphoglycerate mutase n=1 Tax=Candidatus Schneideria nysicola TaxID=1081631 RepID=UPI001CAA6BFB|nr:2,3-diphosphoglycerate-dependent phosphoglycerate mutase [Candidatus Schneideria nysicola]UAJ64999.1 2,3-diphosphoglycerate-dependent phosphoglycerate mutase [Candidatus Schneideria nysicola]